LFGNIQDGKVLQNQIGEMIEKSWLELTNRFPFISLDEFIIMPNHFHGIVIINSFVGAALVAAPNLSLNTNRAGINPAPTLGNIIGAFKSITTKNHIQGVHQYNWLPFSERLWQRNFYDHIIRDEIDLKRVRDYICFNPSRWEKDEENRPQA
jgi:REP element-mobilizing transposase RayT